MQTDEKARTVLFVSTRRPAYALEIVKDACGLSTLWAESIAGTVALLELALGTTIIVTELALIDGNWRDLVEQLADLGRRIPVVLVAAVTTAELWWDALDYGVEDILIAPISDLHLCEILSKCV